jgi:multidrug resistance protein, MATE family
MAASPPSGADAGATARDDAPSGHAVAALPTAAELVSAPGGELVAQSRLAAPLAAQQVGLQLMGAVDTAVLGHYSSAALAGSGVGNGVVFAVTCVAMGILLGTDAILPRALGRGDQAAVDRALRAGVRLAIMVGIPASMLVVASCWMLPALGIGAPVAHEARSFILGRSLGVLPFLMSVVLRSYLAGHGKTAPLIMAVVGGNLINLVGDGLLIFGDQGLRSVGLPALGIPALGTFGSALATSGVQLGTVLVYAAAVGKVRRGGSRDRAALSWFSPELRSIADHGLPIGLQMLAEIGVFAAAGILASQFGTTAAAAHSVALTLASFTFSASVGIGSATAVRVGLAMGGGGRGALALARRRGLIGLGLGLAVMASGAVAFVLIPRRLGGLFTDRPEVLAIAIPLIGVAAVFQLSDGAQAVAAGALRGAGNTRSTLWANVIGHYAVGLPISLGLGFGLHLGVIGLWWGLSAGLSVTAVILLLKFLRITRPSS